MLKRTLGLLVLALLLACWPLAAQAGPAQDTLRVSVDQVLNILNTDKAGTPGRTEKLDAVLRGIFDQEELSRLTLAAHWQAFSPEQKTRFTAAFSKLLEHIYLRRIETYTNERVEYLGESSLGEGRAEVSTKIVSSDKQISVVYRMRSKSGWKIYDVVIEGISLVENYRGQFNEVLSRETPDQLIAKVESMSSGQ